MSALLGCECCLLARRFIRQRGQYLVPSLLGEHVAGAGTDALGVVSVEIEGAYRAVSAGGVQEALRIERDPCSGRDSRRYQRVADRGGVGSVADIVG
jgi:hypothetical protein